MKKNTFIGYIIAMVSSLIMVGSMFLSLTMMQDAGVLKQGESAFNLLLGGSLNSTMGTVVVLYVIAVALALVNFVCAIVGMVLASKGKFSKIYTLVLFHAELWRL